MASKNNIFGIESFEMGTPGDGIMGASLSAFNEIEVNSIVLEGEQATENTIATEANDSYITLNADVQPMSLTIRLFGVLLSNYPMLMGGSHDVPSDTWDAPKQKPNIFLSCRLTATALDGFQRVLEIPYGKVNARVQGNVTKDGIPAIAITITANTPISAAQAEGAPYTIAEVAE